MTSDIYMDKKSWWICNKKTAHNRLSLGNRTVPVFLLCMASKLWVLHQMNETYCQTVPLSDAISSSRVTGTWYNMHKTVMFCITLLYLQGRAIAQAVSRRLPTAAARVRAQVRSCGICGGQSGTGAVFSEYFGFSCQFSFHRLFHAHHHHHPGLV
jgi:hypothetical protein